MIPALALLGDDGEVSKFALLDSGEGQTPIGDMPVPADRAGKKPRSDFRFNQAFDSSGLTLLETSVQRVHKSTMQEQDPCRVWDVRVWGGWSGVAWCGCGVEWCGVGVGVGWGGVG